MSLIKPEEQTVYVASDGRRFFEEHEAMGYELRCQYEKHRHQYGIGAGAFSDWIARNFTLVPK